MARCAPNAPDWRAVAQAAYAPRPGNHLVTPELYNQVITLHGLVMVFGALIPVTAGFANFLIPLMVGAADMALTGLNNWVRSHTWITVRAGTILVVPGHLAGTTVRPLDDRQNSSSDRVAGRPAEEKGVNNER